MQDMVEHKMLEEQQEQVIQVQKREALDKVEGQVHFMMLVAEEAGTVAEVVQDKHQLQEALHTSVALQRAPQPQMFDQEMDL